MDILIWTFETEIKRQLCDLFRVSKLYMNMIMKSLF